MNFSDWLAGCLEFLCDGATVESIQCELVQVAPEMVSSWESASQVTDNWVSAFDTQAAFQPAAEAGSTQFGGTYDAFGDSWGISSFGTD